MQAEIELISGSLDRLVSPNFHLLSHSAVVAIGDVPDRCRVYFFYFEGEAERPELRNRLLAWGEQSGLNLCVSTWGRASNQYPQLVRIFHLSALPAVVATATKDLALLEGEKEEATGFVRIDDAKFLDNIDQSLKALEGVYSEMLRGDFKKALQVADRAALRYNVKAYLRSFDEWFVKHWQELGMAHIATGVFGGALKALLPGT